MAKVITDKVIETKGIGSVHVLGWDQLFPARAKENNRRRKLRSLKEAEWFRLKHDTNFEGITFKAGSLFKFWETEDHGWVAFHPSSTTPEGWVPSRVIFKY